MGKGEQISERMLCLKRPWVRKIARSRSFSIRSTSAQKATTIQSGCTRASCQPWASIQRRLDSNRSRQQLRSCLPGWSPESSDDMDTFDELQSLAQSLLRCRQGGELLPAGIGLTMLTAVF